MKKITFLAAILISAASFAQVASTSFEEPEAIGGKYTDLDDPTTSHPLADNVAEPIVNFTSTGGEMGFSASYVPYDEPGEGLMDGDFVGVTTFTPTGSDPFPDGEQGYQISDVDGNYILEFDEIVSTSTGPSFSLNYYIADEGFEGDGTENSSGSDRIRIYVKDLTNDTEHDILNSTGTNINDLGLQGAWQTGATTDLSGDGSTFQLVIEVRCNASAEAFFFDNVQFEGSLGLGNNAQEIFSIYPNPASNGYVNITSTTSGVKTVLVYDVLGKQVINTVISADRLNVSALTSGVYIMKITQNGISSTKKLVIR
tara:strand:+ start:7335 stop:8273 length:939 start_codon:yes stop_codon:yes gene_type:complete